MADPLYSVRMRASRQGLHISGAERIVGYSELGQISDSLVVRAIRHERGMPDSISICADALDGGEIRRFSPLCVRSAVLLSARDAQELAVTELARAGVSETAARNALNYITKGASPDGLNMRGAMIVDTVTGERLEPDRSRGLRARAVDYEAGFLPSLAESLASRGLDRTHLKEALALATKVANAPWARAELCISDDPSYVTGYVASLSGGYVRITPLKESGDRFGGRAFFVDANGFDMEKYVSYIRETPVLITGPVEFA